MAQPADKSIDDTGERMIPAYHKGHIVYGEHIVRYGAAVALAKDKVVLDIASGSGYGTALLGKTAKKAYGVDLDKDAIKYAKKNYGSKNIEFIQGDGVKIPLGDNSVDIVVSFETIEHIEDYKTFMKEVKRVLKKDGLFILSTPNDVEFPESNHFHVHEFERKELEKLVKDYFKNTTSYYQGTWVYNALLSGKGLIEEWEKPILTMQTAPIELDKCIYFYMLCSNREITETVEPLAAIAEHYSERNKQEYEKSVRKHINEQAAIIKHLENNARDLEDQLTSSKNELNRIRNSRAWKLAKKVHKLKPKKN